MAFGFPTFRQPSLVTYGTGSVKSLGASSDWARTALLVSGAPAVDAYLRQAWAKSGPTLDSIVVIEKPPGEPTWEGVSTAALRLREARPARLIAVGGGAVLDWSRLAWMTAVGALDRDGSVRDTWRESRRDVEVVLVPTTCGSGAEAAAVAVFTDAGRKIPVVCPALLADHVVLDSRFLASVPGPTLAASLADAISHAVEAWVSIVPGRLPREAALGCLRLILTDGPDYDRAARYMDAGFLGGVAAAHCSVGVMHAFAHSVARHGIGHGQGIALVLEPALMRLLPLPASMELVQYLGMTTGEFGTRVGRLVAPAISEAATLRVREVIDAADQRASLRDAILGDPCLRTSPRPFSTADVEALLDDVGRC